MFVRSVRATHAEQTRDLPGDGLIRDPIASLTNAVTIRAAPHEVWPWLVQMGAGRAGWYGHDAIDNDAHPSADRILPQFQKVGVGTLFPWVPGAKEGFIVLAYHPVRSLVLGAPAPDGHPIVTWAFVLEPMSNGETRLIVRARGGRETQFHGLPTWMTRRLVSPGNFVVQRRQLLGIARRAEGEGAAAFAPRADSPLDSEERPQALKTGLPSATRLIAGGAGLAAAAYATYTVLSWMRYGKGGPAPTGEEADRVLDLFMPAYEVVERHHVRVQAPPDVTLAEAREQDLLASPVVRMILKARELVLPSAPEDRPRPRALLAQMLSLGWGVLADLPGREIVVGAVTQPWESNVVFRALAPDSFAAFAEPGFVKIAWSLRADPVGVGESIFRTETRAVATDSASRAKFRRYWTFVSPGVGLVRRLSLGPLKTAAERRAGRAGASAPDTPHGGAAH